MHNVHEKQPVLFQTRWTMNFLAGPLTRAQIPALNRLVGASYQQPSSVSGQPPAVSDQPSAGNDQRPPSPVVRPSSPSGSQTRPPVPSGFAEYFLPQNVSY